MATAESLWIQSSDVRLFAKEWAHTPPARGLLCLAHGFAEHTGRYEHVADFFGRHGFILFGYDLRGHGQSGGIRGHAASFDHYLNDIEVLLAEAMRRHPELPLFLYGHSLGGSQVLNYAIRRKPLIQGVIATSPLIRLGEVPKLKAYVARLLSSTLPSFVIPYQVDSTGLSRDSSVGENYRSDPQVLRKVSVRLGVELIAAGDWLLQHAGDLSLPTLVMQGTADRIISLAAVREFASTAPGNLITYQEWEGGYHELHNDIIKEEVLNFLLSWIESRLP